MEQSEQYKNWIAEIDMRGPAMPLKWLETHIENAPESLKNHRDYHYFKGYATGRSLYEDPEMPKKIDVQEAFQGMKMAYTYFPQKLKNGLGLTAQEREDREYFRGFLDAQILHEELGGI